MKKFLFLFFVIWNGFTHEPAMREPYQSYISGDGFRALAHFVFEKEQTFLPEQVGVNNIIFVQIDLLKEYFETIHPAIEQPYILISHNGDDPAPGAFAHMLEDPKIIAWFTLNCEGEPHPKLHPIPFGIPNRYLGCHEKWFDEAKLEMGNKEIFAYFNLTIQNYLSERWEAYQKIGRAPFCTKVQKKRIDHYLIDLAHSQFVIAPRGVAIDTYRVWEALYLGAYPIVKSSPLNVLYEGLPVVIVNSWPDVTESFLKEKYEEMQKSSFSLEKLQMSYWKELIDSCRR